MAKNNQKTIMLAAGVIALSACASLDVQMDIMNPVEVDRLRQGAVLDREAFDILEARNTQVTGGATKVFLSGEYQRRQAQVDEFARKMNALADRLTADEDKKDLLVSLTTDYQAGFKVNQWDPIVRIYKPLLLQNEKNIQNRATSVAIGEPSKGRLEVRQLIQIRRGIISKMDDTILARLDPILAAQTTAIENFIAAKTTVPAVALAGGPAKADGAADGADGAAAAPTGSQSGSTPSIAPAVARVAEAAGQLKRNLVSVLPGQSLSKSDYAYAVRSADERFWKTDFNRAIGQGRFGNSNIAIKLDPSGNFTVKGMTFDPSTMATIASKVTTQALLLATQLAGVPTAYSGTDQTGFQKTSTSAAGLEKTLAEREAQEKAFQDALRYLARTILAEETAIKTNGTTLTRANNVISSQFNAYSTILTLTPAEGDKP